MLKDVLRCQWLIRSGFLSIKLGLRVSMHICATLHVVLMFTVYLIESGVKFFFVFENISVKCSVRQLYFQEFVMILFAAGGGGWCPPGSVSHNF